MCKNIKRTIIVKGQRVNVGKKVYRAYYQHYEQERYIEGLERKYCVSSSYLSDIGYPTGIHTPSAEDEFLKSQELEKLEQALKKIKSQYRKILKLHFYENMSQKAIAMRLKTDQKAISRMLEKALTVLKIEMLK